MTAMFTYLVVTFVLVITLVRCELNFEETNLSNERNKRDNGLGKQSIKGIQITSNTSTSLDCKDWRKCRWTWDKDNVTYIKTNQLINDFPGQHGFNSTNYIKLSKIKKIFGANKFNIPEKKKSGK